MNVENHSKAFTSKFTKELFILERSHTLVTNAKNHSAHPLFFDTTQWFILKIGHFHATNVKSLSNTKNIWRSTRSVVMLLRIRTMWPKFLRTVSQYSKSPVRNVESFLKENLVWLSIKGRTLEKGHFPVTSVTNLLQWNVICKTTKEGILRKGLFLVIRVTKHFKPLLTSIITKGERSKVFGMLNVCEIVFGVQLPAFWKCSACWVLYAMTMD